MRYIYLCWIDDIPGFVKSYEGRIEVLENDHNVKFDIDEHYNTHNFDSIARNIPDDLTFLVDYNLKGADGKGLDGHEVISNIRKHNKVCPIIFYSSKATQNELRELVNGLENIVCTQRENLQHILNQIAIGELGSHG